jgi:hypothetical protein
MKWYWIILLTLVVVSAALHFWGVVRFETRLHWTAWVVVAFVLLNGGWMAFDGGRALIVGDYVTPRTGQFAGQLGPWSGVVETVGIDPRSAFMKVSFLIYGLAYVAVTAAFLLSASRAWRALLTVAVLGLWYLPFGTAINIFVIILLLLPPLRRLAR